MRIVFLGTSDYGEPALRALVRECFDVAAVVTQPDSKCGRGLHAAPCAIKKAALDLGLRVYQPASINAASSMSFLREIKPDILVVVSYGQILAQEVLDIPSLMPVNIHGSLLPKYRGPAPINWALVNGDTVTGNSLMKVELKMDSGPLIARKELAIQPDDDALTLERKLSVDAAGLLIDGLRRIASGPVALVSQDEGEVSYAPKLRKSDGRIDWTQDAGVIRNRMRGLAGWPGSFTFFKGKMLKLFPPVAAVPCEGIGGHPGTIIGISRDAITASCGRGSLVLREVQPEGKRRMSAGEFIAGHRVKAGDRLESV